MWSLFVWVVHRPLFSPEFDGISLFQAIFFLDVLHCVHVFARVCVCVHLDACRWLHWLMENFLWAVGRKNQFVIWFSHNSSHSFTHFLLSICLCLFSLSLRPYSAFCLSVFRTFSLILYGLLFPNVFERRKKNCVISKCKKYILGV